VARIFRCRAVIFAASCFAADSCCRSPALFRRSVYGEDGTLDRSQSGEHPDRAEQRWVIGDFTEDSPEHHYADPLTGILVFRTVYPRNSGNEWRCLLILSLVVWWTGKLWSPSESFYRTSPRTTSLSIRLRTSKVLCIPLRLTQCFDIICRYNDSISDPQELWNSLHRPLNIRVKQRSMAWSADNIDDFIIFDIEITNAGSKVIRRGFFGLLGYLSVRHVNKWPPGIRHECYRVAKLVSSSEYL